MGFIFRTSIAAAVGLILISWEGLCLIVQSLTSSIWPSVVFPVSGIFLFGAGVIAVILDGSAKRQDSHGTAQSSSGLFKCCRRYNRPIELPDQPQPNDQPRQHQPSAAETESFHDMAFGIVTFSTAMIAVFVTATLLAVFASPWMKFAINGPGFVAFSRAGRAIVGVSQSAHSLVEFDNARTSGNPVVEYREAGFRWCATPIVAAFTVTEVNDGGKSPFIWATCSIPPGTHCSDGRDDLRVGRCSALLAEDDVTRAMLVRPHETSVLRAALAKQYGGEYSDKDMNLVLVNVNDPDGALHASKMALLFFIQNVIWLLPTAVALVATSVGDSTARKEERLQQQRDH